MKPQPVRVPHAAGLAGGIVVAALLAVAVLPAATPRIGLDEIEPGMRGVGVTVFNGATREEFGVEVLGIINNVMGPRRSLIIARLDGGPLAETGVIQGMSGSPIYFDGRLCRRTLLFARILRDRRRSPASPRSARWRPPTPYADARRPATAPIGHCVRRTVTERSPGGHHASGVRTYGAVRRSAPVMFAASGLPISPTLARLGAQLQPIATPLASERVRPGGDRPVGRSAFDDSSFVTTIGAAWRRAWACATGRRR